MVAELALVVGVVAVASDTSQMKRTATACLALLVLLAALLCAPPVQLLLTTLWEDEENPFSGVFMGSAGILRVRLLRNGEEPSGDGVELVYAKSLDALLQLARSRYGEVDRMVTPSGEGLRTIFNEDGSSCIADTLRCVHDGMVLYALRRGDAFVPPSRRT